MWNKILLISIWTVEIPCLLYDAIVGLFSTVIGLVKGLRAFQHIWPRLLLWRAVDVLTLCLLFSEISKYRKHRLHPRFFTLSQAMRALICVYSLYYLVRYYRDTTYHYRPADYGPLYKHIALTLAHCVGIVYGGWAWWQQHKIDYVGLDVQSERERLTRQLMMPSSINQATKITAKGNRVASIVHWIYHPSVTSTPSRGMDYFVSDFVTLLRWIPGAIVLIPTIAFSTRLGSEPKSDQVPENLELNNWNYLKPSTGSDDVPTPVTRTVNVNLEPIINAATGRQPECSAVRGTNMPERLLGPRYLCYLDASQPRGYKTVKTQDWVLTNGNDGSSNYIFISYTRRQFYTQIAGDPSLPAEQNLQLQQAADRDTNTLIVFAVRAAQAAGVEAFWIDFKCVQPENDEQADESMEDVYRICDIVRAAYSLVIITGPPVQLDGSRASTAASEGNKADWLHEWGKRLWTVPEALLCSAEHRIAVYAVGADEPKMVARRNLATLVWDDAGTLRQLVDHYESSIHLTQLELISIALECLQRRQTEKRMSGDVAYALMGLLRQRPRVNKQDSGFQAFARLSLANDSDMLLERLLCLKTDDNAASWHDMRDAWDAHLWDISPLCQISDVVDKDTIILGGAQGSIINWSYLQPIDYSVGSSRKYSWYYARHPPVLCIVFLLVFAIINMIFLLILVNLGIDADNSSIVLFSTSLSLGIPWTVSFILCMFAPAMLHRLFAGRPEDTQARFFGIEGHPDLSEVETTLFGRDQARIRWITSDDPNRRLQYPEQIYPPFPTPTARHFTLIDTLTLTAVSITAKRPPNVVLACGTEHGFLRTVLCSYDAESDTLSKEGTLRMKMTVLERMAKMDMVRFRMVSEDVYNDLAREGEREGRA